MTAFWMTVTSVVILVTRLEVSEPVQVLERVFLDLFELLLANVRSPAVGGAGGEARIEQAGCQGQQGRMRPSARP